MNPERPPIEWTPKMLGIMRDYYPTMFNKALARWLKVSERTLQRKARELGLEKIENFNRVRADDISGLLSEAVKKAYAEGRIVSTFRKGEHSNPAYEFKPGHKFSEEIEEARKEKIRRTYRMRKRLGIYGLTK